MGDVRRMWFLNRELWLRARVNPVAFPSGKTCHISGDVNANLEWTRISHDRRPQVWKHGSPKADHDHQPEKHDHALRQGASSRDVG